MAVDGAVEDDRGVLPVLSKAQMKDLLEDSQRVYTNAGDETKVYIDKGDNKADYRRTGRQEPIATLGKPVQQSQQLVRRSNCHLGIRPGEGNSHHHRAHPQQPRQLNPK